ncbi:hypothetical protein [Xanthomonas phage JGB6]|nr:hypothetical protein [Xanthomonas phage JGB6]
MSIKMIQEADVYAMINGEMDDALNIPLVEPSAPKQTREEYLASLPETYGAW